MKIEIFTDGSATTKGLPGGWAYVITVDDQFCVEGSGSAENVTNNDMELQAVIEGLIRFHSVYGCAESEVTVVSDSQIVLGWLTGEKEFRQIDKIHKYNVLKMLYELIKPKTRWVKGHSGDVYNERCDKLAKAARASLLPPKEPKSKVKKEHSIFKNKGKLCVWHKGVLKILDLDNNTVHNYNEE